MGVSLFSQVTSNKTRGHSVLSQCPPESFGLDLKKKFFTERVTGRWNGLPREEVEAPSLELSKTGCDA